MIRSLNWKSNGFDQFNLFIHETPGDGHCLLHSVLNAFHISYITGILDGRPVSRYSIVTGLRDELATWLEMTDERTGKTNYTLISNGNLLSLGNEVSKYTLEGLQSLLRSSSSLREEMLAIIELAFNKTVIILDSNTFDVYHTGKFGESNEAVVIYYTHDDILGTGHFEMVSWLDKRDVMHVTHFSPEHPFIIFLRSRI